MDDAQHCQLLMPAAPPDRRRPETPHQIPWLSPASRACRPAVLQERGSLRCRTPERPTGFFFAAFAAAMFGELVEQDAADFIGQSQLFDRNQRRAFLARPGSCCRRSRPFRNRLVQRLTASANPRWQSHCAPALCWRTDWQSVLRIRRPQRLRTDWQSVHDDQL
jgi:hypothetical protein